MGPVGLAETNSTITFFPAPVLLLQNLGHRRGVKCRGEEKVEKTGAGGFRPLQIGAAQRQVGQQNIRDLTGRLVKRPGRKHGDIARQVAMDAVPGNFHRHRRQLRLGQLARRHGLQRRLAHRVLQLLFRQGYCRSHKVFRLSVILLPHGHKRTA